MRLYSLCYLYPYSIVNDAWIVIPKLPHHEHLYSTSVHPPARNHSVFALFSVIVCLSSLGGSLLIGLNGPLLGANIMCFFFLVLFVFTEVLTFSKCHPILNPLGLAGFTVSIKLNASSNIAGHRSQQSLCWCEQSCSTVKCQHTAQSKEVPGGSSAPWVCVGLGWQGGCPGCRLIPSASLWGGGSALWEMASAHLVAPRRAASPFSLCRS